MVGTFGGPWEPQVREESGREYALNCKGVHHLAVAVDFFCRRDCIGAPACST